MSYCRIVGCFILTLLAFIQPARAQIGDKPGEAQVPIVPRDLIPPAPPLKPEDALKSFQIAPGFRIELVAAEPLVQDPVAMAIDPQGRMWVVEMRSYMPDLDGTGENKPTSRVSILSDTNGDGKMDVSHVFLDNIVMPRAICLVGDGALIGAPPKLWYCRDKDGDGKCEEQIEIASDYGVMTDPARPELANPERAPNAPLWALDNWIYNAAYTARFRFRNGTFERGTTTFRGQWGLSQDDFGRLYSNSNSDQLRVDVAPSRYLGRNPYFPRPAGANVNAAANQLVWPARVNPGINRGYRKEMLREGKLKEFTAACAPYIYRADLFPADCQGNAFVCEPAGNLIKRNILTDTNGTVKAREAYDQKEFLTSTDERFRPVNLYTGPEGALYVVDLYRGILQHRISLTSYLRKQIEDRGLDKAIHLGRIWRIVPSDRPTPVVEPRFKKETPGEWVRHLSSPNAWWRETAQRLLVERNDFSVVPALQQFVRNGTVPQGKVHALWTLEGLNQLDVRTLISGLKDSSPLVRAAAIQSGEQMFNSEDKDELVVALIGLANDPNAQVRLQLALTLGEAKDARADATMATMAVTHFKDAFLQDAVVTGIHGRETSILSGALASAAPGTKIGPATGSERFLSLLARCVFSGRNPENVSTLLKQITATTPDRIRQQQALLDGAYQAALNLKKPVRFAKEPETYVLLNSLSATSTYAKTRITKIEPLLVWPGKPGMLPEPVVTPLTAAEQAAFAKGKELFTGTCAACHQTHGLGMEGLAPPLADSEWVLGSPERLIRIVLHGINGPLRVKGASYNLDMPAMGVFSDEQIGAILTYLRREWEHTAEPISAGKVSEVRQSTKGRQDAWRQEELLKLDK